MSRATTRAAWALLALAAFLFAVGTPYALSHLGIGFKALIIAGLLAAAYLIVKFLTRTETPEEAAHRLTADPGPYGR